jgi:hypothetical protein
MKTVLRFIVNVERLCIIEVPEHSHFLSFEAPNLIHMLVRTEKMNPPWTPDVYKIYVVRNNSEIPEEFCGKEGERKLRHIGSDQNYHAFVVL